MPTSSRLTVEAVILRADGTREDLGVIATSDPDGPGHIQQDTTLADLLGVQDDEGNPHG